MSNSNTEPPRLKTIAEMFDSETMKGVTKQQLRTLTLASTTLIVGVFLYQWHVHYFCPQTQLPDIHLEELWAPYPMDMESNKSIRPYTIEFSDVIVNDLKERLLHRGRFTPPIESTGKYGLNTDFLTRVLDFWQSSYNFKERERFLNKYPHYLTNVQGLNIHYLHVRPKVDPEITVLPILLIHSWPTSFREFYEMIPLLTTYENDKDFVFEVVVPSLPGFGFSEAPARQGMSPIKMAVLLHNLMKRIGLKKYYVHGGDFGQSIGSVMATIFQHNVLGFHSSMPLVTHKPCVLVPRMFAAKIASLLVEQKGSQYIYPLDQEVQHFVENSGYFQTQTAKPDTTGIALAESPAGLAAYILEKFAIWTRIDNHNQNVSDGGLLNKLSITHLLDNVMIYWVTNSFTTSMRIYVETKPDMYLMDQIPTQTYTWGLKFKHELVTPDFLLHIKYKRYMQSTVVETGSHYPAMQNPKILANDIIQFADAVIQCERKQATLHSGIDLSDSLESLHTKAIRVPGVESEAKNILEPEAKEIFEREAKKTFEPEAKKTLGPEAKKTVYDFKVKDTKGNEVSLEAYKGKVLIIVNVASQCGYTDTHYTQLNQLYEKYANKGLRILAFPCNQFGGQEPGSIDEILQFTKQRNVKFDVFEKINVNGDDTHPLWEFLKKSQGGTFGDFIKWNFSKFIIDRNGVPVERFGPNVSPLELEPYLDKYW